MSHPTQNEQFIFSIKKARWVFDTESQNVVILMSFRDGTTVVCRCPDNDIQAKLNDCLGGEFIKETL